MGKYHVLAGTTVTVELRAEGDSGISWPVGYTKAMSDRRYK
jgi:hypothetical protein